MERVDQFIAQIRRYSSEVHHHEVFEVLVRFFELLELFSARVFDTKLHSLFVDLQIDVFCNVDAKCQFEEKFSFRLASELQQVLERVVEELLDDWYDAFVRSSYAVQSVHEFRPD